MTIKGEDVADVVELLDAILDAHDPAASKHLVSEHTPPNLASEILSAPLNPAILERQVPDRQLPVLEPDQAGVCRVIERIVLDVEQVRMLVPLPGHESVIVANVATADGNDPSTWIPVGIQQAVAALMELAKMPLQRFLARFDHLALFAILFTHMPEQPRQRHEPVAVRDTEQEVVDLVPIQNDQEIPAEPGCAVKVDFHFTHRFR
jgi:hypothetical protein